MEIVDYSEGDGWCARLAKQAVWIKENANFTGEYVYTDGYMSELAYEIIKKTEKRLYVLIPHREDKVLQLDRIAFETKGSVLCGKTRSMYFSKPKEIRRTGRDTEGELLQLEVEAEYQRMRQAVSEEEVETLRKKFPDCPEDTLVKFAFAKKELEALAK